MFLWWKSTLLFWLVYKNFTNITCSFSKQVNIWMKRKVTEWRQPNKRTILRYIICWWDDIAQALGPLLSDTPIIFIFKGLQILKFSKIYLFQVRKFMYSYKIGLLPNVFKEMFLMTNQVHSYNSRNSNTFYLFSARTNVRLK